MALSWNLDTTEAIDFDSFVAYFRGLGDGLLESDLDRSALIMRRLANNREFLTDRLNRELAAAQSLKGFQAGNLYTPATFILYRCETFHVRVNIWAPAQDRPGEGLYFYHRAHDHNFSFLTVGYLGSGYRTRIHEYDPAKVVGHVGERVELRYLEETRLPFGKVMLFRQNVDVHTQLPPDELSISVNVLKQPVRRTDQYFFDAEEGRILGKADKHSLGLLIQIAGAVGDEGSLKLLEHIMSTHEGRRTRLAAYEAVAKLSSPSFWERALADPDPLVRTIADQRLRALATTR